MADQQLIGGETSDQELIQEQACRVAINAIG